MSTKSNHFNPGWAAQLVRMLSHTPKAFGFHPWSGHIPRLWVRSLVGSHVGGSQWMFVSHRCSSLSPHPYSSLSKINKNISLGEDYNIHIYIHFKSIFTKLLKTLCFSVISKAKSKKGLIFSSDEHVVRTVLIELLT